MNIAKLRSLRSVTAPNKSSFIFKSTRKYSTATVQKIVTLNDGTKMPTLALGTWKAEPQVVKEAVATAIEAGYRHIDCAPIYGNERSVGEGIVEGMKRAGNISREDLFITSKLWNTEHHPARILPACEQTIHDLGVGYLDLYLIHWPIAFKPGTTDIDNTVEIYETWEAMQVLKNEDLIKSVGVSNFTKEQLITLADETDIVPSVNQVELHPYMSQLELASYARKHKIHLTAYSPLGTGKNSESSGPVLVEDPTVYVIAERYKKTPAQVLLRWSLQSGFSPLPKSVTPSRIQENYQVFDFSLTDEDMKSIDRLNKDLRFVVPSWSHFSK